MSDKPNAQQLSEERTRQLKNTLTGEPASVALSVRKGSFMDVALREEHADLLLKGLEAATPEVRAEALKAVEENDPDLADVIKAKLNESRLQPWDIQLELATKVVLNMLKDMLPTLRVISLKALCNDNPRVAEAVLTKLFDVFKETNNEH
jgi:hypothetical protein